MKRWNRQFGRNRNPESGATATEYIILLVLVAVAAVTVWKNFGEAIGNRITGQTAIINDMETGLLPPVQSGN